MDKISYFDIDFNKPFSEQSEEIQNLERRYMRAMEKQMKFSVKELEAEQFTEMVKFRYENPYMVSLIKKFETDMADKENKDLERNLTVRLAAKAAACCISPEKIKEIFGLPNELIENITDFPSAYLEYGL